MALPAAAQPGLRAAGRGGSYPAQRDQATSTAELPGRGPSAGFESGGPEYASSRSQHLKAPLAVDSDGVAGLQWPGGDVRYRSSHADVGRAEYQSIFQ